MMTLARVMLARLRSLHDLLADRLDGWLLDLHQPEDLGPDVPERLVCMARVHRSPVPWPCGEVLEVADRRSARRARSAAQPPPAC